MVRLNNKIRQKIILLLILRRRSRKRKKLSVEKRRHKIWMRKIFIERPEKGLFNVLVKDLKLHDSEYFFRNFRMNSKTLEHLLTLVAPYITKSGLRRSVASPEERLCVTLRYLVTGDAQVTIATSFRLSPTTVGRIIRETCQCLYDVIEKEYLKPPNTKREWDDISKEFFKSWNFPNCLGAIDGKHVVIQAPARSGSLYFNYKKTFSIVLLAICNAKYEFTLVSVGSAGRQSDGGVYNSSSICQAIDNNLLDFPPPQVLPNSHDSEKLPFVFVADEAFAMKTNMMRPYPRRKELDRSETIFNYRLSRARRVIENAFGILASRFRVFRRPIIANTDNVKKITKDHNSLHNFLMKMNLDNFQYCPYELIDREHDGRYRPGQWRNKIADYNGLNSIGNQGTNNHSRDAKYIRNKFKEYFNSSGSLAWQNEIIARTNNPFDRE